MSEASEDYQPTVSRRRRWSSVWIIPAVAFLLAGWLVWTHYANKGPLAHVTFETAESIKAGETEVRCRSVRVGVVESVALAENLGSVHVELRIDPDSEDLLREDTRFWVVRPRVSSSAVSGLGTILSGSYIELEPGNAKATATRYTGLEEPPVTASSIPGLRLTLVAEEAGSLSVGAPIYYRGFEVGKVERRTLDTEARRIRFEVFVQEEYGALVRTGTRFWNTSGVDVSAGADGFKLRTPSFQSMVSGGASFSVPRGLAAGDPVDDGAVFTLYDDESAARDSGFEPDRRILLFFDQSVRGLNRGAPVEYRGIPLGRVVEVSFTHSPPGDSRVPVLIELDTRTLRHATEEETDGAVLLADAVRRGLRARLGTASLLTGALFVDLDFMPDTLPAELGRSGEFDVIPTQSSGLAQMEAKINAILAKLEGLPLDETLTKFGNAAEETTTTIVDARETLASIEDTLAEARKLLGSDATQSVTAELNDTLAELRSSIESLGPGGAVQGDLRRTLDELRSALRAFGSLSETIEEKPNSLIFGRESSGDPTPRARR